MATPTVLFVEDNDIFRGIVACGLRASGLNVEIATGGSAAIERLKALRPDLVLLDLALPEVNGLALLSHMRGDAGLGEVPVIVLSAHSGRSMEAEAARRGATRYLVKTDVAMKEIVKLVHELLQTPPAVAQAA